MIAECLQTSLDFVKAKRLIQQTRNLLQDCGFEIRDNSLVHETDQAHCNSCTNDLSVKNCFVLKHIQLTKNSKKIYIL